MTNKNTAIARVYLKDIVLEDNTPTMDAVKYFFTVVYTYKSKKLILEVESFVHDLYNALASNSYELAGDSFDITFVKVYMGDAPLSTFTIEL